MKAGLRRAIALSLGLCALTIPEEFGGLGLNAGETIRVLEYLGTICPDSGLGFSLATHLCSTCVSVARFGSDRMRAELLPLLATGALIGAHAITEPDSGSDAFAM